MSVKDLSSQSLGAIEVAGKDFDIADLFQIDEEDLDKEYRQQASWYAFFSVELAKADYAMAIAKAERERMYSEIDLEIRDDYRRHDEKFTEPIIRAEVNINQDYCDAEDKEMAAKRYYMTLRNIVNALDQRANMLISLGAHRRAEYEMTGMTIRQQAYDKTVSDLKKQSKNR